MIFFFQKGLCRSFFFFEVQIHNQKRDQEQQAEMPNTSKEWDLHPHRGKWGVVSKWDSVDFEEQLQNLSKRKYTL